MKVIGLTGGIGSGKSTVAGYLKDLGAAVIDLDKVGHEVLKAGGPAYQKVVEVFGKAILDAGGEIDRSRLAEIVFQRPKRLKRLNQIMHPEIDKILNAKLEEYRRRGVKVAVLEAAAMLESGKAAQVEEIWVTLAPAATVLKRLRERSGYSEAQAKARINSQLTDAERVKQADVIIDTDVSLDELKARVEAEWQKLVGRT